MCQCVSVGQSEADKVTWQIREVDCANWRCSVQTRETHTLRCELAAHPSFFFPKKNTHTYIHNGCRSYRRFRRQPAARPAHLCALARGRSLHPRLLLWRSRRAGEAQGLLGAPCDVCAIPMFFLFLYATLGFFLAPVGWASCMVARMVACIHHPYGLLVFAGPSIFPMVRSAPQRIGSHRAHTCRSKKLHVCTCSFACLQPSTARTRKSGRL